jgi:hypothetical protein
MAVWLDSLVATPLVGIACRPTFVGDYVLPRVSQAVLESVEGCQSISRTPKAGYDLTFGGHELSLDTDGIRASFRYPFEIDDRDPRAIEVPSLDVVPFSQLCFESAEFASAASDAFEATCPDAQVYRLGIVARLHSEIEALPPGLHQHTEALERSVPGRLASLDTKLLGRYAEDDGLVQQCHYQLKGDLQKSEPIVVHLDWQCILKEPVSFAEARNMLKENTEAAFEHFESFGMGELM